MKNSEGRRKWKFSELEGQDLGYISLSNISPAYTRPCVQFSVPQEERDKGIQERMVEKI